MSRFYGSLCIELSFVLSQCTRLTDGQTDRQLSYDWTALHSMQRGKNKHLGYTTSACHHWLKS